MHTHATRGHRPLLSIVMPCFNEAATLPAIVDRVLASRIGKELVVVDDGSTDGTREIAIDLARTRPEMRVLVADRNRGKGAAVRRGFGAARGIVVVPQDADLEYDPREYETLLAPILRGEADVVFGSRFADGGRRATTFAHWAGNRLLTAFSNVVTGLALTDVHCCYKAFRRTVLERVHLEEDGFAFEPEVTAKLARVRGLRFAEVPVSYRPRSRAEGKKIGARDLLPAFAATLRYGLGRGSIDRSHGAAR